MIIVYHLYLVVAICFPSNVLPSMISTLNLTSLTADAEYSCISKSSIFSQVPTLEDCDTAIGRLHRLDVIGSFHNGPPNDPFKLPVERTFRTCTVSVEMQHRGSTEEAFSWFILVSATSRLTNECLGGLFSFWSSAGALIQFGDHGRIVTAVKY